MTRTFALLAVWTLVIRPALAEEFPMVRLAGTPEEVGKIWGTVNSRIIRDDMETRFLKRAAEAGISRETLIQRSAEYLRIVGQMAPHWLAESRAVARAAGVPEDLYVAFHDGVVRDRFLHECTSYAAVREGSRGKVILFHKNRDNAPRPQAAYLLESSLKDVNKYIAVCDASGISCSMMVNEKGLAGSSDYPVQYTRKGEPSALLPPPAEPKYRGLMNGAILRYIAERGANCRDALNIIQDFVNKGYYAGGKVNGTHWLFVDRQGVVLEVSSNTRHVLSKVHTEKAYFSRRDEGTAAKRLRQSNEPVDFALFHSVSRDPSICLKSSISGMTAEIDPDHPELFTCAWISLPARAASFPLLMGQTKTPACLLNAQVYTCGTKTKDDAARWEAVERTAHRGKELLRQDMAAHGGSAKAGQAARRLDEWSQTQAQMVLKLLQTPGKVAAQP